MLTDETRQSPRNSTSKQVMLHRGHGVTEKSRLFDKRNTQEKTGGGSNTREAVWLPKATRFHTHPDGHSHETLTDFG